MTVMAVKSFSVKNGDQELNIKFDDDIPWGKMKVIMKNSVDFSKIANGILTVLPDEFAMGITMASIIEPKNLSENVSEFDKLPNSVAMDIMEGVCQHYPLASFLQRAGKMIGQNPQVETAKKVEQK